MTMEVAPEQRPLSWVASESDSTLTVRFSGDLDIAVVPECAEGLREPLAGGSTSIVLDLADVTFADTTALRFLIDTKRRAESDGKTVVLKEVSGAVQRVFDATGMTSWFDYVDGRGNKHAQCPLCDGRIADGAVRCSHCGSAL
jgi:anti-sigma B factor antagonist